LLLLSEDELPCDFGGWFVSIFRVPLTEAPLLVITLLVIIVVEELLLALPLAVPESVPVPPCGLHPANAKAAPRMINSFFIRAQARIPPMVLQWGEKLPLAGNQPYNRP